MPGPVKHDELEDFGRSWFGVAVNGAGVFRANDLAPSERPEHWALKLLERRDTDDLQEKAVDVAATDWPGAIVVDGTSVGFRLEDERGSPVRNVSVLVDGPHHCPLIAFRRRDEAVCDDWSANLSAEALEECEELLKKRGLDLTAAPRVCLEPELARTIDRHRFVEGGISYAIRVNPEDRFSPPWSPDDPLDDVEATRVEHIFQLHADKRIVAIRDLKDRRAAEATVEEYLTKFDRPKGPEYFLVRVAASPGMKAGELRVAVVELAKRAAAYAASTPGEALRLHEFRHPHAERYAKAVRIADRWRFLDGLGKDGPNAYGIG